MVQSGIFIFRGDCVATLDAECRLLLYTLTRLDNRSDKEGFVKVAIERACEIRIGDSKPPLTQSFLLLR